MLCANHKFGCTNCVHIPLCDNCYQNHFIKNPPPEIAFKLANATTPAPPVEKIVYVDRPVGDEKEVSELTFALQCAHVENTNLERQIDILTRQVDILQNQINQLRSEAERMNQSVQADVITTLNQVQKDVQSAPKDVPKEESKKNTLTKAIPAPKKVPGVKKEAEKWR